MCFPLSFAKFLRISTEHSWVSASNCLTVFFAQAFCLLVIFLISLLKPFVCWLFFQFLSQIQQIFH